MANKTKQGDAAPDAPADATVPAASPAAQPQTFPVRVTERGDGFPVGEGAEVQVLRAGKTVSVDRPTAQRLTDGGFAVWPTVIRALAPDVVTARVVLAKGQAANVAPDEAERLVKAGLAEVVKED